MREDQSPPAVSVIVPLFNEEENVPILQEELAAALPHGYRGNVDAEAKRRPGVD